MEYPEAGHSFMNNHRGYKILKVLRFRAVGYNEPAAMDARRRIVAFFHLHLENSRP
jgi:dienelactone hydrolase